MGVRHSIALNCALAALALAAMATPALAVDPTTTVDNARNVYREHPNQQVSILALPIEMSHRHLGGLAVYKAIDEFGDEIEVHSHPGFPKENWHHYLLTGHIKAHLPQVYPRLTVFIADRQEETQTSEARPTLHQSGALPSPMAPSFRPPAPPTPRPDYLKYGLYALLGCAVCAFGWSVVQSLPGRRTASPTPGAGDSSKDNTPVRGGTDRWAEIVQPGGRTLRVLAPRFEVLEGEPETEAVKNLCQTGGAPEPEFTLGRVENLARQPDNHIGFASRFVSEKQGRLRYTNGTCTLFDSPSSTNKIRVNSREIGESGVVLRDNDLVQIGNVKMVYHES